MKYKILCTDGFAKNGREILEKKGFEVIYCESLKHDELLKKIPPFDALIVRSSSTVSSDVMESGTNLKVVARAGVGTDNIDLAAATKRGIFVVNAPEGNSTSTAELAFGMLLALARFIPQASHAMRDGRWEKTKFKGSEIAYKTLGVIGLGRVGREVAGRAIAFKMKVMGYDPFLSKEQFESLGVIKAGLEEIYKTSDFITIHAPINKDTENLITIKELKMMKPTARVINCARGGIINENDLANALRNGIVAGAALDVFTKEPFNEPLFRDIPNCITTPHLGASTAEAQDAVAVETALSVAQFFEDGFVSSAVNLPVGDRKMLKELKNHISLSEKLGSLLSQLAAGEARKITFVTSKKCPKMLGCAAVKGLLVNIVGTNVTLVNAYLTAKERGITVAEEIIDSPDVADGSLGVRLLTKNGEFYVSGRIFPGETPKITQYNDYNIEIDSEGTILFIHNADRPGVIGKICTILGEAGINIAEMQNVRKHKGAEALTIIGIDEKLSDKTLNGISKIAGIISVKQIKL